ncbi:Detected protein of unknown function [Hibiscus syriacus]|uniref:Uncharacterized protein n=1 Tax=Hibiscus syriacus TaxID=106335 RepID=A0A6A3AE76_HIBSY|nr:Detected protein of unknown function [Hibiscus syriacus]
MSGQGFDTWILEFRGAGLSEQTSNFKEIKDADVLSDQMVAMAQSVANGASPQKQPTDVSGYLSDSEFYFLREDSIGIGTAWDEAKLVAELTEIFMRLSEDFQAFSAKEVRMSFPTYWKNNRTQFIDIQERLSSTIEDFQKQLDLIVKYDWDFDHYLEEDVPVAVELTIFIHLHIDGYIREQTKPKTENCLQLVTQWEAYCFMQCCHGSEGREPGLNAVATMASALDYRSSKPLNVLLPLADPAQALNVPAVPFGSLLAAAYPLASRPPYVLGWLNSLISRRT